jgi:hypothetical protein
MFYRKSLKIFLCLSFCLVFISLIAQSETIKTPAEESKYTQYSQNEEIARFLSRIDNYSPETTIQIIGKTKETKNYKPKDLYFCIITEEAAGCPSELNREKPTFLLIASQHGNEQSAKEAALLLIRDLAVGELKPLLKRLNFLIIPQANPYGSQFDQRRNEQDLDLNRDHVKLESPEVKAIHRIFRTWMPEVTMDAHEKGESYYKVSVGCVSNPNIHPTLQKFSRDAVLAEVEKNLKKKGITFQEYLVTQQIGIDSSAGVRYRPEDQRSEEEMKRFSTTDLNDGRNSLGIYETLSFIQEGASRHDIQTLRERTEWQYFGFRFLAESIAGQGEKINSLVRELRERLIEKAKVYAEQDLVHLRMKYARDEKEPEIVIKNFERSEIPIRGVLKVDKKAGDFLTRDDLVSYPYPSQYKVVEETVKNWFPNVEAIVSVPRPLGYIIPASHQDVVETMLGHDIKIEIFTQDRPLEIEAYQISTVVPAKYDYLPPQRIDVEKKKLQTIVKRGDFYISCAQASANLISCLLEPQSQYGFIRYLKFNLIPEEGDIFPIFRFAEKKELPVIPYKSWKR